MNKRPQIRAPDGLSAPRPGVAAQEVDLCLEADLQTLREIVARLDGLESRLDASSIPKAVTARSYFTPDEDDRVRQGVLVYRNCRLAAYEIILRYRDYASVGPETCQLRCFLLAFGAALVLYAKSLRIIAFAEHVPMLRSKINEPDSKYDMEAGFFDDVLAGYSRICNYRSILQADGFWRARRRAAHTLAYEDGGDWAWLVDLIRHQRHAVRSRLLHVLWQRLRHDWRSFCHTILSPFRQARHGLESLLGDRFAQVQVAGQPVNAITSEILANLRLSLQPGDVLLTRNDHRLTAAILPGFWTHAALFLGARSDLEVLGLRTHPHVVRHWHEVPENCGPLGLVVEALFPCVQLNPLEKCLCVDHLVVLRSTLSPDDIASAIGEALGHLGKPYDFEFDFNNTSRIVCTELVYRSYHNRGAMTFSLTKRLGRFTLTGDDIIAQILEGLGESGTAKLVCLKPVALVLKRRDGQPHASPPDRIVPLLQRIRRGWRPSRRMKHRKPINVCAENQIHQSPV
jgi:uncharacterized protein YycO